MAVLPQEHLKVEMRARPEILVFAEIVVSVEQVVASEEVLMLIWSSARRLRLCVVLDLRTHHGLTQELDPFVTSAADTVVNVQRFFLDGQEERKIKT